MTIVGKSRYGEIRILEDVKEIFIQGEIMIIRCIGYDLQMPVDEMIRITEERYEH